MRGEADVAVVEPHDPKALRDQTVRQRVRPPRQRRREPVDQQDDGVALPSKAFVSDFNSVGADIWHGGSAAGGGATISGTSAGANDAGYLSAGAVSVASTGPAPPVIVRRSETGGAAPSGFCRNVSVKQERPLSSAAGAAVTHHPSGGSTKRSRAAPGSGSAEAPGVLSSRRNLPKRLRRHDPRGGRERLLDERGLGRGAGGQGQRQLRLRRQAELLADGIIRMQIERDRFCRVRGFHAQRNDDAVVPAECDAAICLEDLRGRREDRFDARHIDRAGKVERRRNSCVARVSPVGDGVGSEPDLKAGEVRAGGDEPGLGFRGFRPIRREALRFRAPSGDARGHK